MAAGSTYTPIQTQTLASSQNQVTFSSIPSTYTDLILVVVGWSTAAGSSSNGMSCYFNNVSTGAAYNHIYMGGDGTTEYSGTGGGNVDYMVFGSIAQTSNTAPSYAISHIMNYANTTTHKAVITRAGLTSQYTEQWINVWRDTAAINRIDVTRDYLRGGSGQIKAGTMLTLYGITAA